MNSEQIRAAIQASHELQALAPDTQAIAEALSGTTTEVVEREAGIGWIMETLGPVEGSAVLDAVSALTASNSAIKWAWYLIERGGLNFGSQATRGMIDSLVSQGVLTESQGAALKGIAEAPVQVTEFQVRQAIFSDTGEVLV